MPRAPRGPRAAWSGVSRTLKDDKRQLEERRTLRFLARHNGPQSKVRDTKRCPVSYHHKTHRKPVFASYLSRDLCLFRIYCVDSASVHTVSASIRDVVFHSISLFFLSSTLTAHIVLHISVFSFGIEL